MDIVLPFAVEISSGRSLCPSSRHSESQAVSVALDRWLRKLSKSDLETPRVVAQGKVYWPVCLLKSKQTFNLVPWDLVGVFERKFEYSTTPQSDRLRTDLETAVKTSSFSDFQSRLARYRSTFRDFGDNSRATLHGFIPHDKVTVDILDDWKVVSAMDPPTEVSGRPIIARMSCEAAASMANTALQLVDNASKNDIERLERTREQLDQAASQWLRYLNQQELDRVRTVHTQIEAERTRIQDHCDDYRKALDASTTAVEEHLGPLLAELEKEVKRWEQQEQQWRSGTGFSLTAKSSRRAKHRAQHALSRAVKQRDRDIKQLIEHHAKLCQQEWARLRPLERLRDQQVNSMALPRRAVSKLTSRIDADLSILVHRQRGTLSSLQRLGTPVPPELGNLPEDEPIVIYVPFWMAFAYSGARPRFAVIPPCVMRWRTGALLGLLLRRSQRPSLMVRTRKVSYLRVLSRRLLQALDEDETLSQEVIGKLTERPMSLDDT